MRHINGFKKFQKNRWKSIKVKFFNFPAQRYFQLENFVWPFCLSRWVLQCRGRQFCDRNWGRGSKNVFDGIFVQTPKSKKWKCAAWRSEQCCRTLFCNRMWGNTSKNGLKEENAASIRWCPKGGAEGKTLYGNIVDLNVLYNFQKSCLSFRIFLTLKTLFNYAEKRKSSFFRLKTQNFRKFLGMFGKLSPSRTFHTQVGKTSKKESWLKSGLKKNLGLFWTPFFIKKSWIFKKF